MTLSGWTTLPTAQAFGSGGRRGRGSGMVNVSLYLCRGRVDRGEEIEGAYPNRPPRPRFLLIGSRVAGSRLSRKISKNQNQAEYGRVRVRRVCGSEGAR